MRCRRGSWNLFWSYRRRGKKGSRNLFWDWKLFGDGRLSRSEGSEHFCLRRREQNAVRAFAPRCVGRADDDGR